MLAICLSLAAALAGADASFRDGFEGGAAAQEWALEGWGAAVGHSLDVVRDAPHGGSSCMRLSYGGEGDPQLPGRMLRRLPAEPYRGRRVVLRVALRAEHGAGRAFLRADFAAAPSELVAGTTREPVRTEGWTVVEVVGEVPRGAAELEIAVSHEGRGRMWVDDVELAVLEGPPKPEPGPPAELSERAVTNLAVLGRLAAILRFFHPSDEAASAEWGDLVRTGVLAVEDAKSSAELCGILQAHFAPVAPTARIFLKGRLPDRADDALDAPPGDGGFAIVADVWRGPSGAAERAGEFAREREAIPWTGKVPPGTQRPNKPRDFDLGASAVARVPLALWADERGTLPHGETEPPPRALLCPEDRASRIAVALLAWGRLQHFSPLLAEGHPEWEGALEEVVAAASRAVDGRELLAALRALTAELLDGQADVDHPLGWPTTRVPIRWDWIGEKLVVTAAATDELNAIGLAPGDVVQRIGERKAADVFLEACAHQSGATTQRIRTRALEALLGYRRMEPVQILAQKPDGKMVPISYKDPSERPAFAAPRPAEGAQLAPGVRYLNLARVRPDRLAAALAALSDAKTLVLDVRDGLADLGSADVLAHVIEEPARGVELRVPVVRRPDLEKLEWDVVRADVAPAEPRVAARVVVVADGGVVGEAEAFVALVRAHGLGTIVGETTGGTFGPVARDELPAGYVLTWTAAVASVPGKESPLGVGVEPQVAVPRRAGGTDDLLDAALRVGRE